MILFPQMEAHNLSAHMHLNSHLHQNLIFCSVAPTRNLVSVFQDFSHCIGIEYSEYLRAQAPYPQLYAPGIVPKRSMLHSVMGEGNIN